MAQISINTFTQSALRDFIRMSQAEYGTSAATADVSHLRWKHLDSPPGSSINVTLNEGERVVGRILVQPRTLCTAAGPLAAANLVDLLIDREYRSTPANFLKITKASGSLTDFDLVYHTSNERTFPLYSRLLRFPSPFALKGYGFPLRVAGPLAAFLGRRLVLFDWLTAPLRWLLAAIAVLAVKLARLVIRPRPVEDAELAALSTKCVERSGPHLARTAAFLKWRFADAPLWPATVYRIDRRGQFLGYVATRKVVLGGLVHLVLMDFLLDLDAPLVARLALRLWLIGQAIHARADALFTLVNPKCQAARSVVGFPLFPIPDKVLPHATPIFVRPSSADGTPLAGDGTIHLTLGDLDYF